LTEADGDGTATDVGDGAHEGLLAERRSRLRDEASLQGPEKAVDGDAEDSANAEEGEAALDVETAVGAVAQRDASERSADEEAEKSDAELEKQTLVSKQQAGIDGTSGPHDADLVESSQAGEEDGQAEKSEEQKEENEAFARAAPDTDGAADPHGADLAESSRKSKEEDGGDAEKSHAIKEVATIKDSPELAESSEKSEDEDREAEESDKSKDTPLTDKEVDEFKKKVEKEASDLGGSPSKKMEAMWAEVQQKVAGIAKSGKHAVTVDMMGDEDFDVTLTLGKKGASGAGGSALTEANSTSGRSNAIATGGGKLEQEGEEAQEAQGKIAAKIPRGATQEFDLVGVAH